MNHINTAEAIVRVQQFADKLATEAATGFKNNGKAIATFDHLSHWVTILDNAIDRETAE